MASDPDDRPAEDPSASAGGDELGQGLGGGMSWCWELDFAALLDAVTGTAPWLRPAEAGEAAADADRAEPGDQSKAGADQREEVDPEAEEAAYQEALAAGRVRELPLEIVAGGGAGTVPARPGCWGWVGGARGAGMVRV